MKSVTLNTLALLALFNNYERVAALEHPTLTSTADYEHKWSEKKAPNTSYQEYQLENKMKDFEKSRRPVVGVLTEPLRGDIFTTDANGAAHELIGAVEEKVASYVPKAHVQFLEQAGIRVVPIDYRLAKHERDELLRQLNGLYLPGDSHSTVTDEAYRHAFLDSMAFAEESALEKKEHFPVFLMGNSLNSYVLARSRGNSRLQNMAAKGLTQRNSRVELAVENPADTYIFNSLDRAETQAVFNTAQFFNMQTSGVRQTDL